LQRSQICERRRKLANISNHLEVQTSTSQFIVMIEVVDSQQVTPNRAKLDIQYLQVIDFIGVIFYEKSTIKTITS